MRPASWHLARMVKGAGGVPAHGKQIREWKAGRRFDHLSPESTGRSLRGRTVRIIFSSGSSGSL
jgi:hypothetical protein